MPERGVVAPSRRARAEFTERFGRRAVRRSLATNTHSFRPPEIVIGVLLVAGCALAAVLWQRSVDRTVTVVVAAHPIGRGSVLDPSDLRGAQMAGETDTLIVAERAGTLIGQVAAVDIPAGTPLTEAVVDGDHPLSAGEALTSMSLAAGQAPLDLARNDFVRLVVIGATDASGGIAATLLDEVAEVWEVAPSPDGVSTIVTVRGSTALTVAVAAATRVQLARVPGDPALTTESSGGGG